MASPRTRRVLQELKPNNENTVNIQQTNNFNNILSTFVKIYFRNVSNVMHIILNGFL